MMKFIQWPLRILAALLVFFIIYLNVALYDKPVCFPAQNGLVNADVLKQLYFLRRMLHEENTGEEMQSLYPEGYVFIYALYALTWCDVVEMSEPESVHWQEGRREVSFCLNALDSPAGKRVFNPDLPLTYGAFYRGWTAYVQGRYLQISDAAERDSTVFRQFQDECLAISKAITQTEKPYLESYRDLAWPADNIVCLATLALHDRITEPRFQEVRNEWLGRIKASLVPEYEMIPHGYDLEGNRPLEGVRGSSQSLMLSFLFDVDSVFAKEQYQQYREHFLAYRLGLPGIREYPKGEIGMGDIDSGPVVLGIGGAASIVGIKAATKYGDWELATALRGGVSALLFPRSGEKEKCYLFGQLPMLDAFMAWSNAEICETEDLTTNNWRWRFQLISSLIVGFCLFLIWKTRNVFR
jgi:hypothetical protein